MSRLVLPFPILLLAVPVFLGIMFFQWTIYEATGNVLGKEVWVGMCAPQKLQGKTTVELLMLCNGEETTTTNPKIILAWINEQEPVRCSKEAAWNSDDVSWDCSIGMTVVSDASNPNQRPPYHQTARH